jgi:thiol-disulfide isomerase/thioredoxin
MRDPHPHRWAAVAAMLLLAATVATAAIAATAPATPAASAPAATPATPATPPSPVSGIRNKLAAGDLLSAESILEVHREKYGEDGPWLLGLGWLSRGAVLLGDTAKARRYANETRTAVTKRLAGKPLDQDKDAENALGAAIEVEAQLLEKRRDSKAAVALLQKELAAHAGPAAFRSRLYKRLNMMTLVGQPAPELKVEDYLLQERGPDGEEGLSTDDVLRHNWSVAADQMITGAKGRPLILFLWAEWCGDCRAQAASLARVLKRHRAEGLLARAITRWYEPPESLTTEKARALREWGKHYEELGDTPRIVSTESMVRYGASATPTFVFIDRKGIVRRYTPTRLSEEELERSVALILR